VSIWSRCLCCSVITVLTREWEAMIILSWWQGAQTRLLSNLSKGNPRCRPKPLSRHNSRSSDDLISYATSKAQKKIDRSNTSQKTEHKKKSAWKTLVKRVIPQTRLLEESRTSWETESRLYLNLSTRVTSFKVVIELPQKWEDSDWVILNEARMHVNTHPKHSKP
jgi:hypothetical protein